MTEGTSEVSRAEESRADEQNEKSPWDDPSIPAGDAPPLPAWPLWTSGVLWAGCVVYLMVTAAKA
jgi:hypothetical protein